MSNLEAELDALVTVYVRSIRGALRDYLAELNPFGESRASSPMAPVVADPRSGASLPARVGLLPASRGAGRALGQARAKQANRGSSSPRPTAEVRAVLDRITAHLADFGPEVRSSDLRRSLAVTRPELQAATKWGIAQGVLVQKGERSTTSFSLARS
jgi:hypothetical protein